jgi:glycine/D-amino acid oxidase-like deaminating enzyme
VQSGRHKPSRELVRSLLNARGMDLRTGQPYWPLMSGCLADYPSLNHDEMADVAVVGAGVTGALVAYELSAVGADVVVLDRRHVAMGSSAATSGLLMYETDTSLEELERTVGRVGGLRTYRLGLDAIDRIASICKAENISCGFARRPALCVASTAGDVSALERECSRQLAGGFDTAFLTRGELESRYGLAGAAALRSKGDGEIDCYRFVHGLLAAAVQRGARVYDRTTVVAHRPDGDGIVLDTDGGPSVRARRAVSAGGYEVVPTLGRETGRLKSTWVFMSEPLSDKPWSERCLVWETARPYLYMRTTEDNRVLVGGEDEPFSDRHEDRRLLHEKAIRLRDKAHALFPSLDLEIACCWAGVFGTTRDGLPYIGSVPERPHTWFALGYGGNGITFSSTAARLITDAWLGRRNPDADMFRFDRAKSGSEARVRLR